MPFRSVVRPFAAVMLTLGVAATSVDAQSAKPAAPKLAPAKPDNQPPAGATSTRMMALIQAGNPRAARSQGASYLSLHPGTPHTMEHCHILVAFAYSDVLLDRRDEASQALGVFDKGCTHTAVRDDYRAEVARVKRVLKGEALSVVYPR
jgi:hypothetical protein